MKPEKQPELSSSTPDDRRGIIFQLFNKEVSLLMYNHEKVKNCG